MRNLRGIAAGIGVVALIVVVVVGGYLLGWWLREDAVNREAEIRRDSFEVQETARDEVLRQAALVSALDVDIADPAITAEQRAALSAQRIASVTQLCNVASDISGATTPAVSMAISRHC